MCEYYLFWWLGANDNYVDYTPYIDSAEYTRSKSLYYRVHELWCKTLDQNARLADNSPDLQFWQVCD